MNDSVTAAPSPAAAPAEPAVPVAADGAQPARRPRRGGRGRGARSADAAGQAAPAAAGQPQPQARAPRRTHPVLDQLAQWYPRLFGEQPLPLKRGIFQDLLAAREGALEKDSLKLALAIHTRSTRYLNAVAAGRPRHDLQGQVVEAMAPEHVYHALQEVFRRRRPRDGEDPRERLRQRIAQACEASGLARLDYDALVRGRDAAANALLDEALALVAERDARAEALARAFEASGQSEAVFADMYGMDARAVQRALARARQLQRGPVQDAAA